MNSYEFGYRRRFLALGCLAALCGVLTGCRSTNATDNVTIDNVYGPTGRHAVNLVEQARRETKGDDFAGIDELQAATKLYEDLKYKEARKAFKDMVKKYGKKKEPVEEDAMFYMAECDFQLGHLPGAEDEYEELLKKFPHSKYLERSVKRIYHIACYWLDKPKPASEIELVSFEEEDGEARLNELPEAKIAYQFPLKPNLFDRTRPLFDTRGRALGALTQVWLHDPTGPLADDALFLHGLYHFRRGDYQQAETDFANIRGQYSKSKYFQAAYLLGADASRKCYQGPQYDGQQLENAKNLTKGAVSTFADSPYRKKLESDIKKMEAEAAVRDWERVKYYAKRKEKKSAAVYCEYIIRDYPGSPEAEKARELLVKLGREYAADIIEFPLVAKSESKEPEEPGRLRISDEDAKPISEAE